MEQAYSNNVDERIVYKSNSGREGYNAPRGGYAGGMSHNNVAYRNAPNANCYGFAFLYSKSHGNNHNAGVHDSSNNHSNGNNCANQTQNNAYQTRSRPYNGGYRANNRNNQHEHNNRGGYNQRGRGNSRGGYSRNNRHNNGRNNQYGRNNNYNSRGKPSYNYNNRGGYNQRGRGSYRGGHNPSNRGGYSPNNRHNNQYGRGNNRGGHNAYNNQHVANNDSYHSGRGNPTDDGRGNGHKHNNIGSNAIVMQSEGLVLESFLKSKNIEGTSLGAKINTYISTYNVPPHIGDLMHKIRINRNIAAHGLQKDVLPVNYTSQGIRNYQKYYYNSP